jgi:vacuolar-type H+-ATPase subunit H
MSNEQYRTIDPVGALKKVREAEAAAERVVKKARDEEAVRILQEAQDESRRIRESLLAEAREKAGSDRSGQVRKAEAEAQKVREETEKMAEKIRAEATPLIPEAVKATASRIAEQLKQGPR